MLWFPILYLTLASITIIIMWYTVNTSWKEYEREYKKDNTRYYIDRIYPPKISGKIIDVAYDDFSNGKINSDIKCGDIVRVHNKKGNMEYYIAGYIRYTKINQYIARKLEKMYDINILKG